MVHPDRRAQISSGPTRRRFLSEGPSAARPLRVRQQARDSRVTWHAIARLPQGLSTLPPTDDNAPPQLGKTQCPSWLPKYSTSIMATVSQVTAIAIPTIIKRDSYNTKRDWGWRRNNCSILRATFHTIWNRPEHRAHIGSTNHETAGEARLTPDSVPRRAKEHDEAANEGGLRAPNDQHDDDYCQGH